jgi:hypothetical protein
LANTAFLSSLKPAAPARAIPSKKQFKNKVYNTNLTEATFITLGLTARKSELMQQVYFVLIIELLTMLYESVSWFR